MVRSQFSYPSFTFEDLTTLQNGERKLTTWLRTYQRKPLVLLEYTVNLLHYLVKRCLIVQNSRLEGYESGESQGIIKTRGKATHLKRSCQVAVVEVSLELPASAVPFLRLREIGTISVEGESCTLRFFAFLTSDSGSEV